MEKGAICGCSGSTPAFRASRCGRGPFSARDPGLRSSDGAGCESSAVGPAVVSFGRARSRGRRSTCQQHRAPVSAADDCRAEYRWARPCSGRLWGSSGSAARLPQRARNGRLASTGGPPRCDVPSWASSAATRGRRSWRSRTTTTSRSARGLGARMRARVAVVDGPWHELADSGRLRENKNDIQVRLRNIPMQTVCGARMRRSLLCKRADRRISSNL